MKILVIGGTGTMGRPLVELLSNEHEVYVVCRQKSKELRNVSYFYGNANESNFLCKVLSSHYDCIIDFCWCTSKQFENKYHALLNATDQYVCLSSAAVVADGDIPLTEDAPRFIDVSPPTLNNNFEYHYEKARIEDILIKSQFRNWTIIRPHITYNSNHIIWGEFVDDQFLLRAILGNKIIVPLDMLSCQSSMTYGGDVALMISKLIGNERGLGEIINVSNPNGMTWGYMLDVIQKVMQKRGYNIKTYEIDNSIPLQRAFPGLSSRYTYDRLINRVFSNEKFRRLTGYDITFKEFEYQIAVCVDSWISQHENSFKVRDGQSYAKLDRISREWSPISSFFSIKVYIGYLAWRIPGLNIPYRLIRKLLRGIK